MLFLPILAAVSETQKLPSLVNFIVVAFIAVAISCFYATMLRDDDGGDPDSDAERLFD